MSLGNHGGRPPKPTALHKLQNTVNVTKHRKRAAEPQPVGDLTDAPDFLTEGQRESWDYAIRHCPPGLLKLIDRGVLLDWCEAEDRHRTAMIALAAFNKGRKVPFLTRRKTGQVMVTPLVDVVDKAGSKMLRCAAELGFSPAARPRLQVDQPAWEADTARNPFAKFAIVPSAKAS